MNRIIGPKTFADAQIESQTNLQKLIDKLEEHLYGHGHIQDVEYAKERLKASKDLERAYIERAELTGAARVEDVQGRNLRLAGERIYELQRQNLEFWHKSFDAKRARILLQEVARDNLEAVVKCLEELDVLFQEDPQ